MKTVFIAFTLKNSSVAEFFVNLSNELSANYRVIIFTHASELHSFQLAESIIVLRWPSKRPTRHKDLFYLLKQIRKYKPTTIIGNFAAVNVFMLGGYLMRIKNRVAWYHTLTTQLKDNFLLKNRKKFFYRLATRICTNSEAARIDLSKSFHFDIKKIIVVNNAVKIPNLNGKPLQDKIVFAGRLHEVKGIDILVNALALVKDRFENVNLVVIGDDEGTGKLNDLKDIQKRLKLEANIKFLGNRSRNYVLKEFSNACFSVVPSYYEAFGYVVIESFSVHTPVIGSNTTGISQIIRDRVDGLLFEPGNAADLAEKIIELLLNPQFRKKLSVNCYQRFVDHYEISEVTRKFSKNPEIFN